MNSRLSSKTAPPPFIVIITIVISLCLLIAAISTSTSLYKKINYLNNAWTSFQNETVVKKQLTTELNHTFIENGLLGDIKRYALYPDNVGSNHIDARISYIKEIISQYKLINGLSAVETSNLLSINNQLTQFKSTFFLIKKFAVHSESERYASIANKLSANAGQTAVNNLIAFNLEQSTNQTTKIQKTINKMIILIVATLLLVPVVIFFVTSYWLSRHKVSSNILAKNNRAELNKMFKYSAVPTVIVNRSGDIINANAGACDLTGYSLNHLLSKHLEQLISNTSPGFLKQIMTLSELTTPTEISKLVTNKDQVIRVEIDITQILEGSTLLSIVSFRDIETEQQVAEQQTDCAEMHNFSEAANKIGSWRWDFSNDKLSWSDNTYDFYGFNKNDTDVTQEIILSCIPIDEREDVSNAINESMIFGNELNVKHHIEHQNGEVIYIHQQGRIIQNDAGKALYMLGSVSLAQKITNLDKVIEPQEQAKEDIQFIESINVKNEISDRVFNLSLDSMAITDERNAILKVNEAFLTTTGFSEDEVIGQKLSNVNRATFFDQSIYNKINDQVQDSLSWSGELWNVRKNGDVYPTTQHICALSYEGDDVARYLCTFRDISEKKLLEERIINSRAIDTLTMLPSRSVLQDRLNQSIKRHERDKSQSAVLIISLKPLIENALDAEHDQVIKTFTQRLIQITRDHDTIARFGQWEFVILLEGLALPEDAYVVAEKIYMKLIESININKQEITPKAAIGISLHPLHATNDESLIQYADAAMQQAKVAVNTNIQTFNKNILELYNNEQHLNAQLKRAIDLKELAVNYQPVISFETQQVVRCVAHVRWHHRAYNSQDTNNFIKSAKHGSLSKPLHDWLLENAFKYATQWSNSGLLKIELQIKIVTAQLKEAGLSQMIKDLLNTYQFPAEQLVLEITHENMTETNTHAISEIALLTDIGVEFIVVNVQNTPEELTLMNANHALINRNSITDLELNSDISLASYKVIESLKESDVYPANFDWTEKTTVDTFKNLQTQHDEELLVCGSIDSQSIILLGQKLQNITA